MLTNYYSINENSTVGSFLRETKEKKNMHYIILETQPESYVDIRTVGLKVHNPQEKLKSMKRTLPRADTTDSKELLHFLIESGDRVVKCPEGYFDFLHALEHIYNAKPDFLKNSLKTDVRMEVYALNPEDKLSTAKNILIHKRINLLPVIDGMKIVGELRTQDLVNSSLFNNTHESGLYDNKDQNLFNLPVTNLMNKRPLTLPHTATIGDAIKLMIDKKVPSIIVTKDENKLYSIISYKDIFKFIRKNADKPSFKVELIGTKELFDDETEMIHNFAESTMKKIRKISEYGLLRIFIKTHGNTEGTHQRKATIKLSLSKGNRVHNVEKEISSGTSDETYNDRVKSDWNIPKVVQEALAVLEKKVRTEKNRR